MKPGNTIRIGFALLCALLLATAAAAESGRDNSALRDGTCVADYNGDGLVNFKDFLDYRRNAVSEWVQECWLPEVNRKDQMSKAKDKGQRIVGGQDADSGEYPWMVALVTPGYDDYNGQFCGASLIDDNWVLTAAHCVYGSTTSDLEVLVDSYDLSSGAGKRIKVKQIVVNPQYNSYTSDYDVALLELEESVSTQTVSLYTGDSSLEGETATVIGWGNLLSFGTKYPYILQEVEVPIVANATCGAVYGYGAITDQMLCAGLSEGGKDSCQGDSGGPLVVSVNGTWQQAGVVSWGQGCALRGYYGVYARVSQFSSWISETMAGGGTSTGCGDYNGDGTVDWNDLSGKTNELVSDWLTNCWLPAMGYSRKDLKADQDLKSLLESF